ncbi:hypothetical protein SESBI_32341 [Sesbania bispinosa]|nr:hypothetical protein SESBI_32341 [Sesbania bispinosa]
MEGVEIQWLVWRMPGNDGGGKSTTVEVILVVESAYWLWKEFTETMKEVNTLIYGYVEPYEKSSSRLLPKPRILHVVLNKVVLPMVGGKRLCPFYGPIFLISPNKVGENQPPSSQSQDKLGSMILWVLDRLIVCQLHPRSRSSPLDPTESDHL